MLSRTADHLFWMARYMERAENTARMLDVHTRAAMLAPSTDDADESEGWHNLLAISELVPAFRQRYDALNQANVIDFMVRDESNPSSILSCLRAARENARAVRGSLTTEVFETHNQTWLEFKRLSQGGAVAADPSKFFEWVKHRSHLSRGVTVGTMLQDESVFFQRIGTFLERADATARLLDVKFHGRRNRRDFFGPGKGKEDWEVDFHHWGALLRSVSGFEVYRRVYRNVIRPERVAELLMLRPDMPRSLVFSMREVLLNLREVANDHSTETLRHAGRLHADLEFGHIDEILATGLHAYLSQFLERVNDLGLRVARDFLVPVD